MKNKIDKYIEVYLSLYKQQNIIERNVSVVLKEIELTFQQFLFLYLVNRLTIEDGEASSKDIRNQMGIAFAGVSRLATRIEKLGLLIRDNDATKIVKYKLTDKGKKKLDKAQGLIRKENKDKSFNVKLNVFHSTLNEINNSFEIS